MDPIADPIASSVVKSGSKSFVQAYVVVRHTFTPGDFSATDETVRVSRSDSPTSMYESSHDWRRPAARHTNTAVIPSASNVTTMTIRPWGESWSRSGADGVAPITGAGAAEVAVL